MLRRCLLALIPVSWAVLASGASAAGAAKTILQGTLLAVPGTGPTLRAHGRNTTLAGKTPWTFHTLQDRRLQNREVRLEGTERPDGSFEVKQIFTVRNGRVYRIRYFCQICNIEALEPGDCVCCQQPTELQEIPVGEPDTDIENIIVTP